MEIEITEMIERDQHITKLQSELIQEKTLIDLKQDDAILRKPNISYCHKLSYPQLHLMLN